MRRNTILIQGAMTTEISHLVSLLKSKQKKVIKTYESYTGFIKNAQIIISKTAMGTFNTAAATCVGITTFNPDLVINQGIVHTNSRLVELFHTNLIPSSCQKIYKGALGTGDVFNREFDRIVWLNQTFGHLCEDMESFGVYTACHKFNVPCIGIRIISNNNLLSSDFNENEATELQKRIINLLDKLTQLEFTKQDNKPRC